MHNIPDLFFSDHFKENFDSRINRIKTDKDKRFKIYLNNNQDNLISTFCFVYNFAAGTSGDKPFKNKLYLLHFNHITGKIDFHLDYYSLPQNNLINFTAGDKTSQKKHKSLKLPYLILSVLDQKHKNIVEYKTLLLRPAR